MNGSPPSVDVCVVTWNTGELTARALRHLLDSEQGCNFHVLVHDNASSDGTPDYLARDVPEADVEIGEENIGFARAVNCLLERSRAPWILLLNSDAWPHPGALRAMVDCGSRHPHAAAVAPRLEREDGTVEHSTHPFPSIAIAAMDALGGRRWLPQSLLRRRLIEGAWKHDAPRPVDWAVGAALLLRREAIDSIGVFDASFFMYCEDLDWCWRAAAQGWEIVFEPSAVVVHIGNVSGARKFGDARMALETAHLFQVLHRRWSAAGVLAYRLLVAAGLVERYAVARMAAWLVERYAGHRMAAWFVERYAGGRKGVGLVEYDVRDRASELSGRAQYWRSLLKATLGLVAPPPTVPPPRSVVTNPDAPQVAVVVPTRNRAAVLPRLVDALERQTVGAAAMEVVVVDDASEDDTAEVVAKLAAGAPFPMTVLCQEVRAGPGAARNLGWRTARAPVITFTDDDCVPCAHWLEAGLSAIGNAGSPVADGSTKYTPHSPEVPARAVVGRTEVPPDQRELAAQPFARVLTVTSPIFHETCNAFYRRCDLEAVGGFDERFAGPSGEDTRLGLAVELLGVDTLFARDAVVRHDVRTGGWWSALQEAWRWVDLPLVLRGNLPARRRLTHRFLFWKPSHPPALAAALALAFGTWRRPFLVGLLPWLAYRLCRDPVCKSLPARVLYLPGALALDLAEIAVMGRGSIRHRCLLL